MLVDNKIAWARKRNGLIVPFNLERIYIALKKAADSIGGFSKKVINSEVQDQFRGKGDDEITEALTKDVLLCLNSKPEYTHPNFPPHIENVQDTVVHVLRAKGFIEVADVYEVYRWGKAKIRDRDISKEQFAGNGYPEEKLEQVLKWCEEHNCETVEKINNWVTSGKIKELIDASVVEYEKSLDEAVQLFLGKGQARVLIVAGPSSSGKTTTMLKIGNRLESKGVPVAKLNLDNYFRDKETHMRDSFGDYDYEDPNALDLALINQHLGEIAAGRIVVPPSYNFNTTKSSPGKTSFSLAPGQVLLLDSLHGFYSPMTASIPREQKFFVYIETLNRVRTADGSFVELTDFRLMRRMLRDCVFRNHPIDETLGHWHYVRQWELRHIITYTKTADCLVNGGLPFELPVLKHHLWNRLPDADRFGENHRLDAYLRGRRIKNLLGSVTPLEDDSVIPGDCHLREFIGGSTLVVPHNE